ncbi:tat pathway signal sequence [Colletotrichum tofieldiae]|uniref:Tat pathway signal sequence n=1 Tax=Colletotrichum tofieldiae TaxID=708197 RepID=A0A166U812_9PEZI|nr:tat pathway signal sequence [Colletotrichum tofieldiae]GKT63343.1 tat pathway signal sequence [Colletotrichum tofieldiae]GKT72646.1 tat pathway signal sequence [Colletotrichum tofieldiae]GKT89516.1 tat pathway signal sequence [Colletotrichum tofieldiae]
MAKYFVLSGTTRFYGTSPGANKAWKTLMDPYTVQITGQEAKKISRPTSKISKDPDYYITNLDVYHQLHCLNDIRKFVAHYNSTEHLMDRLETMHKFHCIDSIRQSLMCNADISLVHWYWAPNPGKHFPNATTTHICKKWTKIEEWAINHRLDEKKFDQRKFID